MVAAYTGSSSVCSTSTRRQFVVLDLDQTLIDVDEAHAMIVARPGVGQFLHYCFERFAEVAIWTNATSEWAALALDLEALAMYRDRFSFVWTAEGQLPTLAGQAPTASPGLRRFAYGKPLRLIFQDAAYRERGWSAHTTLLLDDLESNLASSGNDVLVRPFRCEANADDLDETGEPHLHRVAMLLDTLQDLPDVRVRGGLRAKWWLPCEPLPASGSDAELM